MGKTTYIALMSGAQCLTQPPAVKESIWAQIQYGEVVVMHTAQSVNVMVARLYLGKRYLSTKENVHKKLVL